MLAQADAELGAYATIQAMLDAWNQRDPDALALLFQSDGDLVAADGQRLEGRQAVRTYYEKSLSGPYGSLELRDVTLHAVRTIEEGIFLVDATWNVYAPDSSEPAASPSATLLLSYKEGEWHIVASRIMIPTRID